MTEAPTVLRIAFAPGVTITKWTRRWQERHPDVPLEVLPTPESDGVEVLRDDRATVSFVRLPVEAVGLGVIRLYEELPVLVVSRESELSLLEEIPLNDVDALPGLVEYAPAASVKDAVELVAAGVGMLRLPHSLARLHARKDVVAIPITDGAGTTIALTWLQDQKTDVIEEFIGIVRGRTAGSSRGTPTPPTPRARDPRTTGARSAARPSGRARKRGRR